MPVFLPDWPWVRCVAMLVSNSKGPPDSNWTPGPPRSPPRRPLYRQRSLDPRAIRWTPASGVASQKFGPVGGDIARCALQHTNIARKEPRTQWVSPLDPGWTLHWTPEASGAASACALLSRAYSFSNRLVEMC